MKVSICRGGYRVLPLAIEFWQGMNKFKKEIIISDVSRKLRFSQYFLKDKVENFLKNKILKKGKVTSPFLFLLHNDNTNAQTPRRFFYTDE